MKRYLLKYFVWISLTLAFASCKSPRIMMGEKQELPTNLVSDSKTVDKTVFKTTVVYQGKELSGRVMVKKDNDGLYRLAFYNEMGMTFLEGTLERNRLIIENIIPVLDNGVFIRKFSKSLRKAMNSI